ncbi:hypothetical protein TREES_T100011916 [Tupaia chinensis]|uniref:Uncharacterized protein n=1 Tax=Tupaia chinensis TaxID=246437 RepID=L9KSQ1_TUPCH|nr:hypothetical protein TREES_T100011916 [Tupaia chinensis]
MVRAAEPGLPGGQHRHGEEKRSRLEDSKNYGKYCRSENSGEEKRSRLEDSKNYGKYCRSENSGEEKRSRLEDSKNYGKYCEEKRSSLSKNKKYGKYCRSENSGEEKRSRLEDSKNYGKYCRSENSGEEKRSRLGDSKNYGKYCRSENSGEEKRSRLGDSKNYGKYCRDQGRHSDRKALSCAEASRWLSHFSRWLGDPNVNKQSIYLKLIFLTLRGNEAKREHSSESDLVHSSGHVPYVPDQVTELAKPLFCGRRDFTASALLPHHTEERRNSPWTECDFRLPVSESVSETQHCGTDIVNPWRRFPSCEMHTRVCSGPLHSYSVVTASGAGASPSRENTHPGIFSSYCRCKAKALQLTSAQCNGRERKQLKCNPSGDSAIQAEACVNRLSPENLREREKIFRPSAYRYRPPPSAAQRDSAIQTEACSCGLHLLGRRKHCREWKRVQREKGLPEYDDSSWGVLAASEQ